MRVMAAMRRTMAAGRLAVGIWPTYFTLFDAPFGRSEGKSVNYGK